MISAATLAACLFCSVWFVVQTVGGAITYARTGVPSRNRVALLAVTCVLWAAYSHLTT